MFKKLEAAFLYCCHGDACSMWRCTVLEEKGMSFSKLVSSFPYHFPRSHLMRSEWYSLFMCVPAGKKKHSYYDAFGVPQDLDGRTRCLYFRWGWFLGSPLSAHVSFISGIVKGFYLSFVNILSLKAFLLYPWCLNIDDNKLTKAAIDTTDFM